MSIRDNSIVDNVLYGSRCYRLLVYRLRFKNTDGLVYPTRPFEILSIIGNKYYHRQKLTVISYVTNIK